MATTSISSAKLKKVLAALEANWQAEMEGYNTYRALADRDNDPLRAQVLRHLASAEWEYAAFWKGRIIELGGTELVRPAARPTPSPTAQAGSAGASGLESDTGD